MPIPFPLLGQNGLSVRLAASGETWTVPTGVTLASFLVSGAGGGSGLPGGGVGGGGGGAAGVAVIVAAVTPGEVFTYTRSGITSTLTCTTGTPGVIACTDGERGGDGPTGDGGAEGAVTVRSGRFATADVLTSNTGNAALGATAGLGGGVLGTRAFLLNALPILARGANGVNAAGGTTPAQAAGTHGCGIRFGGVL